MSMHRDLIPGEKHLLAIVGRGDQTPVQLGLTPRELETIATVLDMQASEYQTSADATSVDDIIINADHVADLLMLRDRLRNAYEDQIA